MVTPPQFWSSWVSCEAQYKDAVQLFLEQVDLIQRLVDDYPDDLQWVTTSDEIEDAITNGKVWKAKISEH